MREAVGAVLDLRAPGPTGLSRAITWSLGVHLGVAATVLVWQAFLAHAADRSTQMTISLSGPVGPATGGLTPLGGRQVDQATPATRRPDPIPPVATKPDEMTTPTKSTTKPPPAKRDAAVAQSSVVSPPATGRQVATGSSVVETGARGESTGLAQGGGTGAKVDPDFEFCCQDYLKAMDTEISSRVHWKQESRGTVIVKFHIRSDGTIDLTSVKVDRTSGSTMLDIDAQSAIRNARLPPLPREYKGTSLIVYLTVPY
jgi:TonB family protein